MLLEGEKQAKHFRDGGVFFFMRKSGYYWRIERKTEKIRGTGGTSSTLKSVDTSNSAAPYSAKIFPNKKKMHCSKIPTHVVFFFFIPPPLFDQRA